jgi:hypothetical protein
MEFSFSFFFFVTYLIVYCLQTSFYNTVVKTSDYAVLVSEFLNFLTLFFV